MSRSAWDFQVTGIDGQPFDLAALRGQVLLIVNTASACGFTPQLAGLQALHARYAAQGFCVIGFPCNQFGQQEPGPESEIAHFCTSRWGVGFPLMAKVDVNGASAHPLFVWLKAQAPGALGTRAIKWNFTKFLVGCDGQPRRRFASTTRPEALAAAIEAELAAR